MTTNEREDEQQANVNNLGTLVTDVPSEVPVGSELSAVDSVVSAEQQLWARLREWTLKVSYAKIWRPYLGIAVLVNTAIESTGLTPNVAVKWLTLFDILPGYLRNREVYWLSLRQARQYHGLPVLEDRSAETWDFRCFPGRCSEHKQSRDVLDGEALPQLLKAAMALNTALSSASVNFSTNWQGRRSSFYNDVMQVEEPADATPFTFLTESLVHEGDLPKPRRFMPRPWIGFNDKVPVETIFDASTHFESGQAGKRYYEPALIGRFLDDYFGASERVSVGMPGRWRNMRLQRRWGNVEAQLGAEFETTVQTWFAGQMRQVGNLNYWPVELVEAAAPLSWNGALCWEFNPCKDYWQDATQAYHLPPIRLRFPGDLSGVLPGGTVYELAPCDSRYRAQDRR